MNLFKHISTIAQYKAQISKYNFFFLFSVQSKQQKSANKRLNSKMEFMEKCVLVLFFFVVLFCSIPLQSILYTLALYWFLYYSFTSSLTLIEIQSFIQQILLVLCDFYFALCSFVCCHKNSNFQKNLFDDIYNSKLCYSEQLTHSIDHCEVSEFFF